jgi:hypothetical protein
VRKERKERIRMQIASPWKFKLGSIVSTAHIPLLHKVKKNQVELS